jgi:hypothetical protein
VEKDSEKEKWMAILLEEVLIMLAYLSLGLVGTLGEPAVGIYCAILMFFMGAMGL